MSPHEDHSELRFDQDVPLEHAQKIARTQFVCPSCHNDTQTTRIQEGNDHIFNVVVVHDRECAFRGVLK